MQPRYQQIAEALEERFRAHLAVMKDLPRASLPLYKDAKEQGPAATRQTIERQAMWFSIGEVLAQLEDQLEPEETSSF